jgi:PAS domain-containing protein
MDGPAAARKALQIVLGISLLHVFTVLLVHIEDPATVWIPTTWKVFRDYAWSILSIVVDIALIGIGWELLGKLKIKNTFLSVFLVLLLVFYADTFIFVTGTFLGTPLYWTILKSDLLVRLLLSLIMGVFISHYLKDINFSDASRSKPKNFWEILNFNSDAERKIVSLQENINRAEKLTLELQASRDSYALLLSSINAGIYQINFETNVEVWSDKLYSFLGYKVGEVTPSFNLILDVLTKEDKERIINAPDAVDIDVQFVHTPDRVTHKWFKYNRVRKLDADGKLVGEIGSFIDVSIRKDFEQELKEKIDILKRTNDVMVNRELHMIKLKQDLQALKPQEKVESPLI